MTRFYLQLQKPSTRLGLDLKPVHASVRKRNSFELWTAISFRAKVECLIRRVHHQPVYVEDFEGSLKFLVKVMGFKVVGTPVDAREKVRLLRVGTDLIEVLDAKIFGRRCVAAFYVDSIEAELQSLKEKGVEFEEVSEIGVYRIKEGTHKNVFFRMKGREKLNGGWVEMIEPIERARPSCMPCRCQVPLTECHTLCHNI